MEFIKTVIKNRKLIWQLGKNDFKNRFASTSLGTIWGFLQPFVFMLTYNIYLNQEAEEIIHMLSGFFQV